MLKLHKIAITGQLASGKSTVCKYFKQLNAFVVDADKIVHDLLSSKTPIGQKIIKFLGKDILDDGKISRKKVAGKVFQDPSKLKKLEELLHPLVFEEIENLYKIAKKEGKYLFFVVEIPLLFETRQERFYDYVVVVKTNKKRKTKADEREKRLIDIEDKIKKADFVIINDSSFTLLKRQVIKIANILTKIKENTHT